MGNTHRRTFSFIFSIFTLSFIFLMWTCSWTYNWRFEAAPDLQLPGCGVGDWGRGGRLLFTQTKRASARARQSASEPRPPQLIQRLTAQWQKKKEKEKKKKTSSGPRRRLEARWKEQAVPVTMTTLQGRRRGLWEKWSRTRTQTHSHNVKHVNKRRQTTRQLSCFLLHSNSPQPSPTHWINHWTRNWFILIPNQSVNQPFSTVGCKQVQVHVWGTFTLIFASYAAVTLTLNPPCCCSWAAQTSF